MSTYKMPEVLGGGEFEALTDFVSRAGDDHRYRFRIPGVGLVDIPQSALTEVKPEPAEPGWYLATIGESENIARKAEPDGWSMGRDGGFLSTWKTFNEDFPGITLVRLTPAPAPVSLPWTDGDITLRRSSAMPGVVAAIEVPRGRTSLTRERVRELIRALSTVAEMEAPDAADV